jgi:hypothetical protein
MSVNFFVKLGARLGLIAVTALALGSLLPAAAQADDTEDTIDLEIDAAASTPWNIVQALPGDSGMKTIELRNVGTLDGFVYIWISDIVSSEGTNPESETGNLAEPGELDKYLHFIIYSSSLVSNVSMPNTINNLPTDINVPLHHLIKIPLDAGDTVTALWQWSFPDTGTPQNDAQGDTLSFTINYYLSEPLPEATEGVGGPSGPVSWLLRIDILGATTNVTLDGYDKLIKAAIATGPDGKKTLELESGTKITSADSRHVVKLEMRVHPDPPLPPSGMQIIGDAYDLIGYTADTLTSPVAFDPPAKLTLDYDTAWLPEGAGQPCIAFCEDGATWRLVEVSEATDNPATVAGLIDHTSLYAILVEVKPAVKTTVTATTTTKSTTTTKPVTPTQTTPVTTPTVTTSGAGILPTTTTSSPTVTQSTVSTTIKQAGPGVPDLKEVWRQVSLSVALAGVTSMSVLAIIERRRRSRRIKVLTPDEELKKPG